LVVVVVVGSQKETEVFEPWVLCHPTLVISIVISACLSPPCPNPHFPFSAYNYSYFLRNWRFQGTGDPPPLAKEIVGFGVKRKPQERPPSFVWCNPIS